MLMRETEAIDKKLSVQTARAALRWRAVAVFIAVILILGMVSFYNRGVRRACYGVLSAAAALALIVQYSKERTVASNRLLAEAVVTNWRRPVCSRSRVVNAILSRLSGNTPVMKYSFTAFDQKTYTGETGWGARDLYIGARILIVYDASKPARSHPLRSFVFYSFRERE
jgi:hypothetical protein